MHIHSKKIKEKRIEELIESKKIPSQKKKKKSKRGYLKKFVTRKS